MLVRSRPHRRSRSQIDPSTRPFATNAFPTASVVGGKFQITFDTPVQLIALPTQENNSGFAITVAGLPPTAAVQDSPTQITLTYAAPVATGQAWAIPDTGKAIRTPSGGYVAAAAGTF